MILDLLMVLPAVYLPSDRSNVCMGGARNLKLGATGSQGPGHRGPIIFCVCGTKCRLYSLVAVCIENT